MTFPFLLYHKIDVPTPDVKIRGAYTMPRRFERQIAYLLRRGVRLVTASELVDSYVENGRFSPRTAAITFDDGWKDCFTNAFPIMQRLGVTATIFIVPAVLGETTDAVTADGEGPREHMSADDVRAMSAAGIEIGSHSLSHGLFDRISEDEISMQISSSKSEIESLTQKECSMFSYPAGFYNAFAQQRLREANYKAAFTTVYGPPKQDDLFALNRTEVLRRDGYPFAFGRKFRPLCDG